MKNVFIIALLITCLGIPLSAGGFGMGVKAGMPISFASGEDWNDTLDMLDDVSNVPGIGITVGLYYIYDFNTYLAIQAETLVGLYVWSTEGRDNGFPFEWNLQLFLAEIPMMAKVKLPIWKGSVYFLVGPDFFYSMGYTDIDLVRDGNPGVDDGWDTDPIYFWGATAGTGYELYLGKWLIGLEARYTRTLQSFTKGDNPLPDEMFINAINVNLAVGLRF